MFLKEFFISICCCLFFVTLLGTESNDCSSYSNLSDPETKQFCKLKELFKEYLQTVSESEKEMLVELQNEWESLYLEENDNESKNLMLTKRKDYLDKLLNEARLSKKTVQVEKDDPEKLDNKQETEKETEKEESQKFEKQRFLSEEKSATPDKDVEAEPNHNTRDGVGSDTLISLFSGYSFLYDKDYRIHNHSHPIEKIKN